MCQIAVDQPVAEPRRREPIDLEPIADRNLGTVAAVRRPKQPRPARELRQNSDDVGTLNTAGRVGGGGRARRDKCQRAREQMLQRRGPSLYLRQAGELWRCDNNQSPGTSALKTVTSPEDKLALELRGTVTPRRNVRLIHQLALGWKPCRGNHGLLIARDP